MISDAKLQAKIRFNPHENQQQILSSKSRDIVICAGRRFGKSVTCAYVALKLLAQNSDDLAQGKDVKPVKIWIVAPTYGLADKVFEYLVKWFIRVFPDWASKVSYRPFPTITTPFGAKVECKSAENPAGLLGEELDLLIIDECSRIKKEIYESYLYPTLAGRKGRTFLISTPFGINNWFHIKWVQAKSKGGSFHFQSKDNPFFPLDEWDRARRNLPEQVFQQEYQAQFLSEAAAVFRGIDEIIRDDCLRDPIKGHLYYCGVDLAKHRDFTVICIMDTSVFPHRMVYYDRFHQIDYPFQRKRIIAAAEKYKARIIVDSTAMGEAMTDDLKREYGRIVEGFKFTGQSKKELVEKLSILIEQRKIRIPSTEQLIDELKSFAYTMTDSGNIKYSAPEGLHDDCVISLALACWKLRGKKMGLEQPPIIFNYPKY